MASLNDGNTGHFFFDPQDPIYADHFPGYPVVPGSVIVHAFMSAVSLAFQEMAPTALRDFRFKRFVSPGEYTYCLQEESKGVLACTLFDHQTVVATGKITYDAPSPSDGSLRGGPPWVSIPKSGDGCS